MKHTKNTHGMRPVADLKFSTSFSNFIYANVEKSKVCKYLFYGMRTDMTNLMSLVLTTSEVNYLTIRNDGTISYLPAGRTHKVNERGEWMRDGRATGKPAKIVRKLFTRAGLSMLRDSDFEIFSNMYNGTFAGDFEFQLHDASEIADIYDCERMSGDSSLNGSCMNGDGNYLDIYTHCNSLQILCLWTHENDVKLLAGRALVWTCDDFTFMDRVYVARDYLYERFLLYCEEQKWVRKVEYKSFRGKTTLLFPDGTEREQIVRIETDTDFNQYPYIDTLSYGGDGFITNDRDCDDRMYTYDNTNGERDCRGVWDEIGECYISLEHCTQITRGYYRGTHTHVDNTIEVDGYIYWSDDNCLRYSDRDGCYYLDEDCVYSEYSGSYILRSEAYLCGDDYYHENDVCRA